MELLIGDLKETLQYKILTDDGDFKDVCDWEGVQCNSAGNVTKVEMASYASPECGETLNLAFMPPHVTFFSFSMNSVRGTLDTQSLPAGLRILRVTQTLLMSGSIETKHLPRGLTELDLELNAFDGELDLNALPPALVLLNVLFNKFTGSVNMKKLPATLSSLFIGGNQFFGGLDFSSLAESIEDIDVCNNRFSGSFVLTNVPPRLRWIDASNCRSIIGVAVVAKSFAGQVWLRESGVTAVTDENGHRHAMEHEFLTYTDLDWETLEEEAEFDAANRE